MPFYVGGTAGMRNMGAYAAGTTYYPNDMVQYSGTSYIATATTTGNLPTNTAYWNVLAVGSSFNITSQSGAYLAKPNDFVLANATLGSFAVTLPTAPALNTMVAVKKSDATTTTVTVVPPVGVSINGDTTGVALVSNGASVTVQYDGANWQIVATGQPNIGNSVAGLPTGGGLGQILTKSSTSNYDVGWGAAPTSGGGSSFFPWVAGGGRVYIAPPLTSQSIMATLPPALTSSGLFYPVYIPAACTISSISVFCPQSSSYTAYPVALGLYSDVPTAPSTGPAVRLAYGSASLPATNYAPCTVSLNYVVSAPTNLWAFIGCQANPNWLVQAATPLSNLMNGLLGFQLASNGTSSTIAPAAMWSSSTNPTSPTANVNSYPFNTTIGSVPIFAFAIA